MRKTAAAAAAAVEKSQPGGVGTVTLTGILCYS